MSCLPPLYDTSKSVERKDILPTLRQGYLTKRTLHNRGRKVLSPRDKLVFVILSPNGLYIFDHDSLQRNQNTNKYIELNETGLKFEDKTDYETKRFQFDLVSDLRHIQFQCLDYNDKDNWISSCKEAVELCQKQSPKVEEEWNMTAEVSVTISQAKDLLPCNGAHGDHYCLVIMDREAKKTETIPRSSDPKWTQGGTFKFQIHKMPEDLLIVVFDAKNHHDALGQVYLKIDSARSSNDLDDWYPLRPVNVGERAAGKLQVKVQCRYDAETQRKVTFGVHLKDLMSRPDQADLIVPDLAYKCLTRLHHTSLKTQGLFRVSGNKNKIRDYETQWDRSVGGNVELNGNEDEHTVAGLFKLFLRELPEPLIPYKHYDLVMEASKDPDRDVRIRKLKELVGVLPQANRDLLFYTCSLLHSQTKYADVNLMKPTNLAIVFGSVFSYSPPDRQIPKQTFLTTHLPQLTATCENLIQEFYDVFNIDANTDPIEQLKACGNRKSSTSQNKAIESNNETLNVNGTDVLVH
ncbi:hypothetical protein AKO1_011214 [Acrasis kona]|uniref:Uncharacterized protein n=1 Tax=Acrasis kona TaxID=1008807 RepID=A0AAW2YX12_9EUKA